MFVFVYDLKASSDVITNLFTREGASVWTSQITTRIVNKHPFSSSNFKGTSNRSQLGNCPIEQNLNACYSKFSRFLEKKHERIRFGSC